MTRELHFSHLAIVLLSFSKQLMISQSLENNPQVGGILLSGLGIEQDVIDQYHDELIQIWSKNSVHEIYKRHWCIH